MKYVKYLKYLWIRLQYLGVNYNKEWDKRLNLLLDKVENGTCKVHYKLGTNGYNDKIRILTITIQCDNKWVISYFRCPELSIWCPYTVHSRNGVRPDNIHFPSMKTMDRFENLIIKPKKAQMRKEVVNAMQKFYKDE